MHTTQSPRPPARLEVSRCRSDRRTRAPSRKHALGNRVDEFNPRSVAVGGAPVTVGALNVHVCRFTFSYPFSAQSVTIRGTSEPPRPRLHSRIGLIRANPALQFQRELRTITSSATLNSRVSAILERYASGASRKHRPNSNRLATDDCAPTFITRSNTRSAARLGAERLIVSSSQVVVVRIF